VKIRVLIVDDEPLARRKLRRYLNGECDVEVVGECGDGPPGVAAIEAR
jgi:two-component system LytT family response regulator